MIQKSATWLLWLSSHSAVRYIIVGGITFALDLSLLVLLHGVLGVHLVVATTVAYWASIAFNFTANRFWAFRKREKEQLTRHLTFYLILLGFNYIYTVIFVAGLAHVGVNYGIAKVFAVLLQTSWTYVAYKKVVFK